jgi:hypothetical protein
MAKIDRREYLKRMAAAGLIVGMTNLDPFTSLGSFDTTLDAKDTKLPDRANLGWIPSATPPGSKNLTLLFQGLMGFAGKRDLKQMQVGFNKGDGRHKFEIHIYRTQDGNCGTPTIITYDQLSSAKAIRLSIIGQPPDVTVFHSPNFDRLNSASNVQDFRWMLDFEDTLFYPDGVDVLPNKLRPVLYVNQGIFYTHQLSNSTFYQVKMPGNFGRRNVGRVPRLLGASLEIPSRGSAVLEIDGDVKETLTPTNGVRYEIQFINECFRRDRTLCKWPNPQSNWEYRRNDFHMHRPAFKPKKAGAPKFGLKANEIIPGMRLNMCGHGLHKAVSDESPCMGVGFGQIDGFPPVP